MPIEVLAVHEFLAQLQSSDHTILDSRSEGEYEHAHIPKAMNVPLMNNDERKIVGTLYKKEGREKAVLKGFELVGPRFHSIIKNASKLSVNNKHVFLYCWRGGMRSNTMAWLLSMNGFNISLLKDGYKAYRNHVLQVNSAPYPFIVLGGPTGSGKTEILKLLAKAGEQVIDLEGLANHKGSAFGGIGQPPQPSSEQFENMIAQTLSGFDLKKRIWVENESRNIGSCILPEGIYNSIRTCPLVNVDVGLNKRIDRITEEYGVIPFDVLAKTSEKLKKRLGPQHLKSALEHLENNDFNSWLMIMLHYYDKLYNYGNSLRSEDTIHNIDLTSSHESEIATQLIALAVTMNKTVINY